jgi:hypothetical protein
MRTRVALLGALLALGACVVRDPPAVEFTPLPETRPDQIDQVVFLVGDGGKALFDTSPLMVRLQQETERWSAALARQEAVSVVFLGDNVYETGIHDVGDPRRPLDSLHLRSQVETLAGPNFKRWRNRGFFIGGNHDWGNLYGVAGLQRIQNQERMLDAFSKEGIRAGLYPKAGAPGPTVVDSGRDVRFVFLDTHWWLQADHLDILRDTVFFSVTQILEQSRDRSLIFVSHHPFASGGAHGGPVPIWRGFGILWLLKKTGSLVQDLNSPVYRELQGGLENLFEKIQRPLIYAGGHDHNLQVIEQERPDRPQWTLVSGSASKTSDVGPTEGMRYGADLPGFMRIAFRTDGGIELHVFAAPIPYMHCGDEEGEDVGTCMREGPSKYEEVYSSQLREPHQIATEGDTAQAR